MRAFAFLLPGLCLLLGFLACSPPQLPTSPPAATTPQPEPQPEPESVTAVRRAIRATWPKLVRSNADLARAAADPKFPKHTGPWPVYVPATDDLAAVRQRLRATLSAADFKAIDLRTLPKGTPREPGLLYLPHPYVVPGGRFNEMYGWDSYFILLGLLRNGDVVLARNLTDNLLYEVQHYGQVLNANRSYYLTRSQPPLLTRMVLAVHAQRPDIAWLRAALPTLEASYKHWTDALHTTPTGLARYADAGTGPAPEVTAGELDDQGKDAYRRAREAFKTESFPGDDIARFYDKKHDQLTAAFYAGDRAMRESGFDTSNRFGPLGAATPDFNPVCLNALLYAMESDMRDLYARLGEPASAQLWADRAARRREAVDAYLWDPARGLYLDYDFKAGQRRDYPYLTTFMPLWAGLATPAQAATVASKLPLFASPGGLRTSTSVTGHQWDAPFGWAPLQWFAVSGLRRYGFMEEATRTTVNYLTMVTQQYKETERLWEKYDVVTRRPFPPGTVRFGYVTNEPGFGWTNGVYEDLYATLPAAEQHKVGQPSGGP